MQKSTTHLAQETQKIGEDLAKKILARKAGSLAVVLALQGDLGAGKTTFLQGFAQGLGIEEKINSPTFVIMKRFMINHEQFKNFYHFDLYRLHDTEEILPLGFEEIINNPENIVAIEWPEKISDLLPKHIIHINLEHLEENKRTVEINI